MTDRIDLLKLKDKFLFLPIGGCNKIGTNIYLYHYNGDWIAIDCGLGFADGRENPGADILIPDLSFLVQNKIKLKALIITHSHEDHIGAICDVHEYLKCPIYLTTFAKNFLEVDLLEANIKNDKIKMIEVTNKNKKFQIGSFDIEMIPMTHSAIESHAVLIKTKVGSAFHTGDWRIDPKPVLGELTNIQRLTEIGLNNEVSTLICDSTNCMKDKEIHSEADVENDIYKITKSKNGIVVVTTFASSIGRIKIISNVARRTGRSLVVSGHSMHRIIGIARKSGYLSDVEFLDLKDAKTLPRNRMLLLATGCQGEELATMSKLAHNKHPFIRLSDGDTVIFSSSTIPGNEIEVSNVINAFINKKIDIITNKDYNIHTSGHPYKTDLKTIYDLLKPKSLIPMHGDWLMLNEHIKFAKQCGIKKAIASKNGALFSITNDSIEIVGELITNVLCMDGTRTLNQNSVIFNERIKISKNGLLICSLTINNKKSIVCYPEIKSFGLFERNSKEDVNFIKSLEEKITKYIKPGIFGKKLTENINEIKANIITMIQKEIKAKCKKAPIVDVFLGTI